jgi:carbonic anhydrase/acetyltransferase-like protein (isoleucine patch superfamily)
MTLLGYKEKVPRIDPSAYVAPTATIIGEVAIGKDSSVWFNSVIRGDDNPVDIGEESNVQDLTMIHPDLGKPVTVGNRVTVGHSCVLHGCIIEDDCLIGMGSILMNGVRIGRGSIVAAGSVVREDTIVPPFSLVAGAPGKAVRTYKEDILDANRAAAQNYRERAALYRNMEEAKRTG